MYLKNGKTFFLSEGFYRFQTFWPLSAAQIGLWISAFTNAAHITAAGVQVSPNDTVIDTFLENVTDRAGRGVLRNFPQVVEITNVLDGSERLPLFAAFKVKPRRREAKSMRCWATTK